MGSFQAMVTRFLLRKTNIWNKPLDEVRKTMENIKPKGIPEGVEIRNQAINGINCEVFCPGTANKRKAVLYLHGGGFCLGIYPANREFAAELAKRAGTDVYMPDYRLAPEHPFPAALSDAAAVYEGLLESGLNANDIVVAGDSSGCALALSALEIVRRKGLQLPAALAFITPVFDLTSTAGIPSSIMKKDPFRLKDPLGIAKNYIDANDPFSPLLSPLYGRLDGLPATLVHAAGYDVFLGDSMRFCESCKAAGGNIELKVWKKMWHIFHMQASFVPESGRALEELCLFIKRFLYNNN